MRLTELKGRPVVDPTTARKRGVVVDVLIDPSAARLAAVELTVAGTAVQERVPAEWIACIGRHAVMLRSQIPPQRVAMAEAVEPRLNSGSLVGLEVLDEGGDRVGRLADARVDPETLAISAYLLAGARWRRWLRWRSEIRAQDVTAWSRELMLVERRRRPERAVSAAPGRTTVPRAEARVRTRDDAPEHCPRRSPARQQLPLPPAEAHPAGEPRRGGARKKEHRLPALARGRSDGAVDSD